MAELTLRRAGQMAYREALPDEPAGLAPVLCVHGFPQSSYVWRHLLPALAESGRRAVAPDLRGFGDSAPDPPGTWERHTEALEWFRQEVGLDRFVLVVHDWGGLIGLRWACDHPGAAVALVISNTGFFPDSEWHDLGKALRTKGQGETLIDSVSREGLGALLGTLGSRFDDEAVSEYWEAFTTEDGRRGMLELFRSGDFSKLEPYRGRLAALGVPALIIWGDNEEYTPAEGAHNFAEQLPDARLVFIDDAGHFVFEDEPERCVREVLDFLDQARV
ncbi:MAG: alpha/beta hydrolase [Actinomycetota bacterium]